MEEIAFLGHIVSKEVVKPDPSKIKAVQEWELLKNAIEIRSFLGLAGDYRRIVKCFIFTATRLLTDLLKKNIPF